ncbi:MAG: undecaprenyl-diphosphate phosphatase [Candidatus Dormibacteraeota bacterium]|nr:undecaprenyl-diphosphate phosphatase [Candidatus Dormibacteraeota bacterium]MBV9525066.1 undecaprenyl-diphosphate phosphatase [Candidatus Dormibacteraeota bacterium]
MLGAGLIFFLAALQGATELFPVSSLGHAVLVPPLLHLGFNQSDPAYVPVLTVLHLGTAVALIILYRAQWWAILQGLYRAVADGDVEHEDARLGLMLIAGTIPAGLVGVVFQDRLKTIFAAPRVAAAFLLVNAAILLAAEWFRRRDERRHASTQRAAAHDLPPREETYLRVEGLTFPKVMIVGLCQVGALFPGISRSGVTMAAGLFAGLRHQEAARFSFLLATPIILAAGVLESLDLGSNRPTALVAAAAAVVAGVFAYVSARFLLRYLRFGRLDPFAYYCAALGVTGLILVR